MLFKRNWIEYLNDAEDKVREVVQSLEKATDETEKHILQSKLRMAEGKYNKLFNIVFHSNGKRAKEIWGILWSAG